ncbi:MAG TPA: M23 family metallopeptidase [Saprospiraceae bacterium]|nr:M23 family metallopeptidase [Saprospiraceae bacterium]
MIIFWVGLLSMVEHASKYPQGDFVSPVNRQMKLSGTFGELRTNHFHGGLDVKSLYQVSGDSVYAAGAGYISKITIEEFGYGNSIAIEHPNGYTTLYAHLDKFVPEIESYVKEQQYMLKSFEVELFPGHRFPVRQSQQIAFMGNTGMSFGPHLHFEVRHTYDQTQVNPLLFGFDVPDKTNPVIQNFVVYEFDALGQLLNTDVYKPKYKSAGEYYLPQQLQVSAASVGFGIRSYDTQDGATNPNGIYSIQCKADDEPAFAFALDEIPKEQTRYLNAHIDYKMKVNENIFTHRCYALEGNKLPIYYTGSNKGKFEINREQPRHFTVTIADFSGNLSTLTFDVIKSESLAPLAPLPVKYDAMGEPEDVAIVNREGIQVVWPEGSFYEKTPLKIDVTPLVKGESFSPYYELSPLDIPIHSYFDIAIDGLAVPASLQEKAFIARCEPNGSIINCGGTWVGNNLTTGVRQMGQYSIIVDTIPPKIATMHFNAVMTGWERMVFKIYDNVRIRDKGRNLLYNASVDGEWILMEMDGKSGLLSHTFDGKILPGNHTLIIKVTDDRGNEGVLEKTFTL